MVTKEFGLEIFRILIGNGALVAVAIFLLQYYKHKENIEMDKRKTVDYFISHNYDKLVEVATKLNQILLHWFNIVRSTKQTDVRADLQLWYREVKIKYDGEEQQTCFAKFIHEYDLFIPTEVLDLCIQIYEAFGAGKRDEVEQHIFDATMRLRESLYIKESMKEVKKRFDAISKIEGERKGGNDGNV